jgi:uncharacterized membrane protein YdfJ with MMPL/SSD domain
MVLVSEGIRPLIKGIPHFKRQSAVLEMLARWVGRSPWTIVVVGVILAIGAFEVLVNYAPNAIEYDFLKLRNKASMSTGSKAIERRVSKYFKQSLTPAAVIVDQAEDGPRVCEAVMRQNEELPESERRVGRCYTVYDLLPKDQGDKDTLIKKIRALLTPQVVSKLKPEVRDDLKKLEQFNVGREITIGDLPYELARRFEDLKGNTGSVVYIDPQEGMLLSDGRNLLRFAATVNDIHLDDGREFHAAGEALIYNDLVALISKEAPLLTFVSLLGVVLFVIITLRSVRVVGVIVGALIWAVLLMMGGAAVYGIKVNFFNFIILPLTFGIGVDYAINVAHRMRQEEHGSVAGAIRHAGGAVTLCSLTTLLSYFVLARANNQLIATFGAVAIIGEIACLISAIVLVPALINLFRK